jgi:hypothetical protein
MLNLRHRMFGFSRHCEERSDEAIQVFRLLWIASYLAMTGKLP